MNRKIKKKLIEDLNDAFIEFLRDYRGRRYADYIKRVNTQIIERGGVLNAEQIRGILREEMIDMEEMALFGLLLGAITSIIENARMTQKQRESVLPIVGVVGVFAVTSPKTFVKKVYTSTMKPKSANELRVNKLIQTYKQNNVQTIARIKNELQSNLMRTQTKAKLKQSKMVIGEIDEMTSKGIPLEKQRNILQRKYNRNKVISRAVDTEIHANIETSKTIQAQVDGFQFKEWRTQGDSKVRKTKWHIDVPKLGFIAIEQDFKIGNMVASAPGDVRLPPKDRINCRCYLVFR